MGLIQFLRDLWRACLAAVFGGKPWEPGPLDILVVRAGSFLDAVLAPLRRLIERHGEPIFRGGFLLLLAGTLAASIGATAHFANGRHTASRASPGPGTPRRDPEVVQKELEEFVLANNFPKARERLAELKPVWARDARYYQAEGALHMVDGRNYTKARESFLDALELSPNDLELLFDLAEADFASGNYSQAETGYKKLKYALKENEIIPFRLYLCALQQGNRPEAESRIGASDLAFHSPSWFYIRAVEAFRTGQIPDAESLLHAARLMHGSKLRAFDQTLRDLGLATSERNARNDGRETR